MNLRHEWRRRIKNPRAQISLNAGAGLFLLGVSAFAVTGISHGQLPAAVPIAVKASTLTPSPLQKSTFISTDIFQSSVFKEYEQKEVDSAVPAGTAAQAIIEKDQSRLAATETVFSCDATIEPDEHLAFSAWDVADALQPYADISLASIFPQAQLKQEDTVWYLANDLRNWGDDYMSGIVTETQYRDGISPVLAVLDMAVKSKYNPMLKKDSYFVASLANAITMMDFVPANYVQVAHTSQPTCTLGIS